VNGDGSSNRRAIRWSRADPVWALSAALCLSAAVLYAVGYRSFGQFDPPVTMPLWLLALAFAASERFVVHVPLRGHAYTATLSEIPLVLGLILADPLVLVVARIVGGASVLLPSARRARVKFLFNLSHFALESCLALVLYRLLLDGHSPVEPRGWVAALATTVLVDALAATYIAAAIGLHERRFDATMWRRVLGVQTIAALTSTSLALVAAVLLENETFAVLLLVAVVAVLLILYRAYSEAHANYARLQLLQTFTGSVANTLNTQEVLTAVLQQARTLLRAHGADMILLGHDGQQPLTARSRLGGPESELRTEEVAAGDHWWAPALTGTSVLAALGAPGPPGSPRRDGMAVPLRSASGIFGVLIVLDRLDDVTTFDREDLRLFETLANHAAVSLQNGRLVDRLRQEVAEREHQASHDSLTGLPNRRMFAQRVEQALSSRADRHVGVMILDLDGFKDVNDTLGHHTGDALLRVVSRRLVESLGPRGVVARLGGDEFAILLPRVDSPDAARSVARELARGLDQPISVEGMELDIGGSIGLAVAPEQGDSYTVLMQRADVAMYTAKGRGAEVELYESTTDTNTARRLALVADLRRAIQAGELDVRFQPKADLLSGGPVGAEALVRWHHSAHGHIPPDEFVPLAERAGIIRDLTLFVLDRALDAATSWRAAGADIGVAVNLSVRNLLDLGLAGDVARALTTYNFPPELLTLELTESHIMSDPTRCIAVLRALDELGVRLSIDDFGTGYSSLAYLRRLPVDEVKIDKTFIIGMSRDADDATIVRSTVNLAHDLGLAVVAEGVEDEATWRELRRFGCDIAQGWHLSKPLSAPAFAQWLRQALQHAA
jgi:diguanylate cyclase (GGDEF)-like protein